MCSLEVAHRFLPLFDHLDHIWSSLTTRLTLFCPRHHCFHTCVSTSIRFTLLLTLHQRRPYNAIPHVVCRWPYLLCYTLPGMRASREFASPRLAWRWVPRTVAHIYCAGNIPAPRRSPFAEGRCPGCRHWCLSRAHRVETTSWIHVIVFTQFALRMLPHPWVRVQFLAFHPRGYLLIDVTNMTFLMLCMPINLEPMIIQNVIHVKSSERNVTMNNGFYMSLASRLACATCARRCARIEFCVPCAPFFVLCVVWLVGAAPA